MQTVRKFYWRRYCLALCDEIFNLNFPLLDETLRHIELFAKGSSVTYCDIRQNLSNSADPSQSLHIIGYGTLAPPENNCVPSIPLKSLEKLCHHLLGRGWKNDGMRPPRHPLGLVTSNDLVQYSDTTSTSSCLYKGKTISKHGGPDQWERDKLFIVFFKKLLKFSSLFYEKGIGGDI